MRHEDGVGALLLGQGQGDGGEALPDLDVLIGRGPSEGHTYVAGGLRRAVDHLGDVTQVDGTAPVGADDELGHVLVTTDEGPRHHGHTDIVTLE